MRSPLVVVASLSFCWTHNYDAPLFLRIDPLGIYLVARYYGKCAFANVHTSTGNFGLSGERPRIAGPGGELCAGALRPHLGFPTPPLFRK